MANGLVLKHSGSRKIVGEFRVSRVTQARVFSSYMQLLVLIIIRNYLAAVAFCETKGCLDSFVFTQMTDPRLLVLNFNNITCKFPRKGSIPRGEPFDF